MQVIRNEADTPPRLQAAQVGLLSPLARSRYDGAMLVRSRWEAEKARRDAGVRS